MAYAPTLAKIVSATGLPRRRRDRLKAAMAAGRRDQSLALAERGAAGRIDRTWFAARLAEMKLDVGDHAHVLNRAKAGDPVFARPEGRVLHVRALMMAGDFDAAERATLDLVMRTETPDALRLVRLLPPGPQLLDRACAAFQRSGRSGYRKAIQASHLVEAAIVGGDVSRGFAIGDRALQWLDGAAPEGATFTEKDMSGALHRALADFHGFMAGVGPFFLISGTLLGVKRDDRLMGYDKDIDVGVFDDGTAARIAEAAATSFLFSRDVSPNISGVKVKHRNGVLIDVFLHHVEGDMVWHGGPAHVWDNAKWWSGDADRYATTVFRGLEYRVPRAWEAYLEENYGDWRTPVVQFNASTDAPNRRIADRNLSQLLRRQDFIKFYHRADVAKLMRTMASYEQEFGADDFLAAARRVMLGDSPRGPLSSTAD